MFAQDPPRDEMPSSVSVQAKSHLKMSKVELGVTASELEQCCIHADVGSELIDVTLSNAIAVLSFTTVDSALKAKRALESIVFLVERDGATINLLRGSTIELIDLRPASAMMDGLNPSRGVSYRGVEYGQPSLGSHFHADDSQEIEDSVLLTRGQPAGIGNRSIVSDQWIAKQQSNDTTSRRPLAGTWLLPEQLLGNVPHQQRNGLHRPLQ